MDVWRIKATLKKNKAKTHLSTAKSCTFLNMFYSLKASALGSLRDLSPGEINK